MTLSNWPSLVPQRLLADRLFGERGDGMVNAWLDRQVERTTNARFALLFSEHVDLPGIASSDYNHRLVRFGGHRLLGGIRFYGHDLARPFVEVIAHDLARDISAAEPRALQAWHAADQMTAIRTAEGMMVGLLAVAPGAIEWIGGDEVNEEVVASAHNGHGYAASAQRAWSARTGSPPERLLIGTIDRLNVASRRTALRAGRRAVLDYVFVPLPTRSRDLDERTLPR